MIFLGKGVLTWYPGERKSDRYGAVWLMKNDGNKVELRSVEGFGELWALVKETRESHHIGDLFRGFVPTTPEVGEKIKLGKGMIFLEDFAVGLTPEDGRGADWLDPKALYRVHDQTVELYFEQLH